VIKNGFKKHINRTLSVLRKILQVWSCSHSASEMTYIVSSGALNSTHSLTPAHSRTARRSRRRPSNTI